jgi:hypothetical protein
MDRTSVADTSEGNSRPFCSDHLTETRRSFPVHSIFEALDLRSFAAALNRCSAP